VVNIAGFPGGEPPLVFLDNDYAAEVVSRGRNP
jgi:hypothetical protein